MINEKKCSDTWFEVNWNNPYFWSSGTKPIGAEIQPYSSPGSLEEPTSYSRSCQHEYFIIDRNTDGYVVGWVGGLMVFS